MSALQEEKAVRLRDLAARLRIDSIQATTAAGSGHPSSCASAAEIVSALFFSVMRFNPAEPDNPENDAFVLSKGHAAPLLYSALAEAGVIPREELLKLRRIDSILEGHPTPRIPFVKAATGSLGQGLSVGVGLALAAKHLDRTADRTYVLLGDGESAEGAVWEAAASASHYGLDNLCAILDINRLGQSEPTMAGHDLAAYERRWQAFGWRTLSVDGHDVEQLLSAFETAAREKGRPTMILARTLKGKGIPEEEDKGGFHGKPVEKEAAEEAIRALERQIHGRAPEAKKPPATAQAVVEKVVEWRSEPPAPPYAPGGKPVATRKAFGEALAAIGAVNQDIVVLDGDVKNSTYTELFQEKHPERFFQMYIAEQNMVGAAMGLAAKGKIPFAATFACFLARAYDFVRMAAIGGSNIKLVGTHAGVSIGEDGPSQMGLEDLAMFAAQPNFLVLYPSDAVSAWRSVQLAAERIGPAYLRMTRPNTPVIYEDGESFQAGKCKVLRRSGDDRITIVGAGVTLFEALKAHKELLKKGIATRIVDLFSVQPIDAETLAACVEETGGRVLVVEDHYARGGIGEAVGAALAQYRPRVASLAVREIPRSGSPAELMDAFGISAGSIVRKVELLLEQS
ncbi:MAG: transketolase [Bryobacteraceae bacterium]|nr:transketolase [Bryobacteraceae bacterium]